MCKMWSIGAFLLLAVSRGYCQDRKLHGHLNPGCRDCGEDTLLVYTRGDSATDSLHQLWDLTRGKPTLVLARTQLNSSLSVVWREDRPVDFTWSSPPDYSFALVIDQIWEYSDANDSGTWRPGCATRRTDTARLAWRRRELRLRPERERLLAWAPLAAGNITIDLSLFAFTAPGAALPHLVHSANSTLAEISLEGASVGLNNSRLALRLLVASTEPEHLHWSSDVRRSLDDEHTPGIFEMVEVVSPASARGAGGFLQYRPVSYTAPLHEVTASTLVQLGWFNRTTELPSNSTAEAYFARSPQLLLHSMIVSFGSTGDGFYTRTNYTAWSLSVGYGSPPLEGFSVLVLSVLCVGLAVPALLLVGGLGYAVTRRARSRRSGSAQRLLS